MIVRPYISFKVWLNNINNYQRSVLALKLEEMIASKAKRNQIRKPISVVQISAKQIKSGGAVVQISAKADFTPIHTRLEVAKLAKVNDQ